MTNINSKFLVVNSEDENAPKTKSQHQADLSNRKTNPKSDKPRWIKTSIVIGVVVLIISSAIIAKKFSTSESSKFVNGILDKIKLERGHGKS